MRKKLFDLINGKFIIEKTNQENPDSRKILYRVRGGCLMGIEHHF